MIASTVSSLWGYSISDGIFKMKQNQQHMFLLRPSVSEPMLWKDCPKLSSQDSLSPPPEIVFDLYFPPEIVFNFNFNTRLMLVWPSGTSSRSYLARQRRKTGGMDQTTTMISSSSKMPAGIPERISRLDEHNLEMIKCVVSSVV